jgi:hypothetical protein
MKNYIMCILLCLFGSFDIGCADSYNDMRCKKYSQISKDDIVLEMLRSSNFDFAKWNIDPKDVNAFCDTEQDVITCQVGTDNVNFARDETASFSPIGTISYDTLTNKLYNISTTQEQPVELEYNKDWKAIFDALKERNDIKYVILHKKKYLYDSPNMNAKSKKFLTKNDCAMILNQKSNNWYKIYFYNSKLGTNTVLWLKDEEK